MLTVYITAFFTRFTWIFSIRFDRRRKGFCLLGFNAIWLDVYIPKFRRKLVLPSYTQRTKQPFFSNYWYTDDIIHWDVSGLTVWTVTCNKSVHNHLETETTYLKLLVTVLQFCHSISFVTAILHDVSITVTCVFLENFFYSL
jgi:hypothetical protein